MPEFIEKYGFVMGLVLSIPLSILANVLTPRVQRWIAENFEPYHRRRISQIKNLIVEVDRIRSDASYAVVFFVDWVASLVHLAVMTFLSVGVLLYLFVAFSSLLPIPGVASVLVQLPVILLAEVVSMTVFYLGLRIFIAGMHTIRVSFHSYASWKTELFDELLGLMRANSLPVEEVEEVARERMLHVSEYAPRPGS